MLRTLILGLNMAIAVIVPLWVNAQTPKTFTTGEAYLLGVGLFIALTVMETAVLAERAFRKDVRLEKVWEARATLDARLQEVRRLFHEVEEEKVADTDLFVSFFNKKLADLETGLRDACSRKEVRIDETMLEVTTWLVKSSFRGRDQDKFRAIHFTADNDFFLGLHAKRYFVQTAQLVKQKKCKEVRRIVVYDTDDDLRDPLTQRITQFHQDTDGYSCRVMSHKTFIAILSDYALQALIKDFGIYGDSYLYKGLVNRPDQIVGFYSRNRDDIERFTDCFDTCWATADEPKSIHQPSQSPMTVDALFDVGTNVQALPTPPPALSGVPDVPITTDGRDEPSKAAGA